MADISVTEAATGGGAFAAVWHGIKWLTGFVTRRLDRREAELNAREKRLDEEEAAQVSALRKEIDELKAWQKQVTEQREQDRLKTERLALLCRLMLEEIESSNPSSPLIAHGRMLLYRDFPELFAVSPTPPDMLDTLKRID